MKTVDIVRCIVIINGNYTQRKASRKYNKQLCLLCKSVCALY